MLSQLRRYPLPLLALALVTAGCSGAHDGEQADPIGDQLQGMTRVVDVEVGQVDGHDSAVVAMAPGATGKHVAAVLNRLGQWRLGANAGTGLVTLGQPDAARGAETGYRDVPRAEASTDARVNTRNAALLVAAYAEFRNAPTVVRDGHLGIVATGTGQNPQLFMKAALKKVRASKTLRAVTKISVTGRVGAAQFSREATIASAVGLKRPILSRFNKLQKHLNNPLVRRLEVTDRQVTVAVRVAGENPPPRALTTKKYGPQLWPILHSVIDTVADFPRTYSLAVNHPSSFDPATPATDDWFLRTRRGMTFVADARGRNWNAEALRYRVAQAL